MTGSNRVMGIENALTLAAKNREEHGWLWTQYIVAFMEDQDCGSALEFVLNVYRQIANKIESDRFSSFLSEVASISKNRELVTMEYIQHTSKKVWYDDQDLPGIRKGLTRILDSIAFFKEQNYSKYRIELSRALQMSVEDGVYGTGIEDFELKARQFVDNATSDGEEPADPRRLKFPGNVSHDSAALELISVWSSEGKVTVMTRERTSLDDRLDIWGEIVAATIRNISHHVAEHQNVSPNDAAARIVLYVNEQFKREKSNGPEKSNGEI